MEDGNIMSIIKGQFEMQRDLALSISTLATLVKTQGQQIEQLALELQRCASAVNELTANRNVIPFSKPPAKDP